MRNNSRVTADGYDRIGPFHPKLVWAAILLVELVVIVSLLTGFVWVGDKVEDRIAPGGTEWIDF